MSGMVAGSMRMVSARLIGEIGTRQREKQMQVLRLRRSQDARAASLRMTSFGWGSSDDEWLDDRFLGYEQ
jgi:nitrate/nitrite-specific signal transduction histidine kinase